MLQPTYDAIDRPNAQLRTSHPIQGAVGPASNPIEIGAIMYVLSCVSLTKFAKIECKSPGARAFLMTPSTLPLSQAFLSRYLTAKTTPTPVVSLSNDGRALRREAAFRRVRRRRVPEIPLLPVLGSRPSCQEAAGDQG